MKKIGLLSVGVYLPKEKLTNADLENMVDTTDEWITTRTGIQERRIAKNMLCSDLATRAAQDCLSGFHTRPELIISSTATNEYRFPYQASTVANRLGLIGIPAFDLNAACSGLVYSMAVAHSMMMTGNITTALVTASERMSCFLDYQDRTSCILFGDGASALLLSSDQPEHEILTIELGTDATGSDCIIMGGPEQDFYFRQTGKQVFKFAVQKMGELIDSLKKKVGWKAGERFFVLPHQANKRMMESVAKDKEIPLENFVINIEKYGNTSSASIGIALKEAWEKNLFQKGDYLFLIGFGGGLSWGAAAIRW